MLSSAFTMIAIVCLWVAVQLLFLSSISQNRAQDLLYNEFRGELAGATAPVGPIVPPGDPVALLTIPSIGLEQVVVEGTASGDLLVGPGHRRDTALPGQVGHVGRLRPRGDVRRAVRRPDRAARPATRSRSTSVRAARSSASSASAVPATRCPSRRPRVPPA